MKKSRIGLFKTALESVAEADQQVAPHDCNAPAEQTGSPADPVKTEEVQPQAQATQQTLSTDAEGDPAQAPAEVQAALAETAEQATPATAQEAAAAPETSIVSGVTTDEPAAEVVDDCSVADITDDVAELVIRSSELNDNSADLVKATDAIDELEDLVQTAESTGIDNAAGVAVLELAVEHVFNRIGLEHQHYALEDGSSMQSSVSEKVANIKAIIVRLFKALMEAIGRAAAKVRDYLQRITHVAGRTAIAADQLKRRVRALSGAQVEGKLNNQRLANQLGVFKDTSISRAFENLQELCTGASRSVKSGYIDHLNKIVDAFLQDRDSDKLIESLPQVLERAFDDALPHDHLDAAFDVENVPDGGYILVSNLLPGNAVGVLVIPKTVDDLRVFSYSIERARDGNETNELDILNRSEMEWLLESIVSVCKMVQSFHADVQKFGSLESKLSSAVKHLDKQVTEVTPDFRRFISALTAVAPALAQGIHEKSFAYAMQCASAGLRYVEASLVKQEAMSK